MTMVKAYDICNKYSLSYKTLETFLKAEKSLRITSLCSDVPSEYESDIKAFALSPGCLADRRKTSNGFEGTNELLDIYNIYDDLQPFWSWPENQKINSPAESTHMFEFEKFYYGDERLDSDDESDDTNLTEERYTEESSDDYNAADPEGEFWYEWKHGDIERLGY